MRKPLVLLLAVSSAAVIAGRATAASIDGVTTPVMVSANPDYRKIFDNFDAAFYRGQGLTHTDNSTGVLAWMESYLLQGYMQMYRATSDRGYLRSLAGQFDKLLAMRDDKLGRIDDHTSTALAGWGSSKYNRDGAQWHVFIVHTGMIILGPAEFVNLVSREPRLQAEFGVTATRFRSAIEESIRDAEPYWKNGPGADEGYYTDPVFGLLPLNQSNALGCVLLEMHDVTKNAAYLDHARRLAQFFKNRLRKENDRYTWAYWPDRPNSPPTTATEDISHAAINVDFAVRCAQREIVFTRDDIRLFANTWLKNVSRTGRGWAGTVGGDGDGAKYSPGSAGRWLVLCTMLDGRLHSELHNDVVRAYRGESMDYPSHALGVANLLLYRQEAAGAVTPLSAQQDDHGRPVDLVARDLGVTPEQFREAFKSVRPAPAGQEPTEQQRRQNRKVLSEKLGVSPERLDEVMDKYRPGGKTKDSRPKQPRPAR